MKCTGKKLILAGSLSAFLLGLTGCGADDAVLTYEKENYNKSLYEAELFAEDLCVTGGDVSLEGTSPPEFTVRQALGTGMLTAGMALAWILSWRGGWP